jgi:hypothetical protein
MENTAHCLCGGCHGLADPRSQGSLSFARRLLINTETSRVKWPLEKFSQCVAYVTRFGSSKRAWLSAVHTRGKVVHACAWIVCGRKYVPKRDINATPSIYYIITQYKPTKCTFSRLIFQFVIFDVFYMFRTRGFIFRKTAIYTGMV